MEAEEKMPKKSTHLHDQGKDGVDESALLVLAPLLRAVGYGGLADHGHQDRRDGHFLHVHGEDEGEGEQDGQPPDGDQRQDGR